MLTRRATGRANNVKTKWLGKVDDSVISIAVDRDNGRVIAFGKDGAVRVYKEGDGTWTNDRKAGAFITSVMQSLRKEFVPRVASSFLHGFLFLVLEGIFGLAGGGRIAVVLVDVARRSSRVLLRTDGLNIPPDPIGTSEGFVFCGFQDAVAAFKRPRFRPVWVDRPDGEEPEERVIAVDGIHYSEKKKNLIVMDSIVTGPDRIRVYHLDTSGKAVKRVEFKHGGTAQAKYRGTPACDVCRGACFNAASNEIAYVMSPDEWVACRKPKPGATAPMADFYVHRIGGRPRRFRVQGEIGRNVGFRRSDRLPASTKRPPAAYWLYSVETDLSRSFVYPVGRSQYLVTIPGGTLLSLDTKSGYQKTLCQFESEISSMKLGFGLSLAFIGLATGELFSLHERG